MKKLILTFVVLLATTFTFAQNVPPAMFYSDLTSAPNTGGQNNAGAFVTVHGKGFGASQGSSTVTVGGGAVAGYQSWSDTSVTFQLGSAAKTGSIVVSVGGVSSNSVPFTVRSGKIYFVASTGNDSYAGSNTAPWKTLVHAVSEISAGSIVYVENGYAQSSVESDGAALVLNRAGTPAAPIAILGYPNSSVTIGSSTRTTTGVSITAGNWVLANLIFRGAQTAVSIGDVTGIRLAGNDVSCPNATASGACLSASGGSSFAFLGNSIHNNGSATSTNLASYQALYLLNTNGVEIGWNVIANTLGCNAIGVHSNSALQYSYLVHDNYIYETPCEAIALGTVNPSLGAVSVYNNIIQSSGTGPAPAGASQGYGYAAIEIGGGSSTPAQVYNNTIHDAGAIGGESAGAIRALGAVNLTNNIFDLLSGEQYVSLDSTLSWVSGSNNLFNGAGSPLGVFSDSVAGDPLFVSVAANNFHLAAGSPAIDAGATVTLATDYDGVARPQGPAYDIGAYEYPEASQAASQAVSQSAISTLAWGRNHGAKPAVSFSPTSLTFASQTVATTSAAQTVTLKNTGTAALSISGLAASGSFAETNTCGSSLAASASCTISVTFTPTAAGTLTGAITFTDNAAASPQQVSLSGTAAAAATPAVSLSPTSLTFASQTIATTSAAQTVTLKNTGTASLSISGIAASGSFAETNTCGSSLAASASCSISVTFAPTAVGTLTGAITFTNNAAASPQQVSLSGTAAAAPTPAVSLSPTSLTFASQTVATTSTAQTVTLTNSGAAALSISGIAASGNFAETTACPSSLPAGASCTISVTFTPTAAGTLTGSLTFTDNAAASPQQVGLSGTGAAAATPAVSLSPTSLTFASQTVGTTSAAQTVTLTNSGAGALSISGIAASGNFAETTACPSSLPAGASCTISVTFTPTAAGTLTGAITFTDNAAASPQKVSLSGTAAAAPTPAVSLSPTSLTFASQTVGTTSAAQTVTLTNSGAAALSISGIAASGSFAETTACPSSLPAGASCTISVTFTPTAAGALTGSLTFTDNAAASPQKVSLSGTAVAAAAAPVAGPTVQLSWTESSTGVAGYNVYRSLYWGTAYTLVNSSPVPSQSYTDTTVSAGQTYFYVFTSVSSSGVESAYSAQVTAAVPTS